MCKTRLPSRTVGVRNSMEALHEYMGEFGRWQLFIFLACGLVGIPGAWTVYVMTFYSPKLDFWCARPSNLMNVSVDVWRNYSSPLVQVSGQEVGVSSRCAVYDWDYEDVSNVEELYTLAGNKTRQCERWEYDKGIYERTMKDEVPYVHVQFPTPFTT